jgi:uncharacterized protein (DUF1697 family)
VLHVAWLRGINVAGNHRVLMADLRAVFVEAGFTDVATYIQSGNVVFTTTAAAPSPEPTIEALLGDAFGFAIPVVVRSLAEMADVVGNAPPGFGDHPTVFHSDVWFLKSPLDGVEAVTHLEPRPGVDQVWPGRGVVYVQRLSERRAQSRLTKVTATPIYRSFTVRNWATTTRVLAMMRAAAG